MDEPTVIKALPWHQSRLFDRTLKGLAVAIVGLAIFQLGQFVGYRKASFSFDYGKNYHMVFGGPRQGLMNDLAGKDFMNGHGVSGSIAKINGDSLIVESGRGAEIDVIVTDGTRIIRGRTKIHARELRIRDLITAIGHPQDDGAMRAEIIRVLAPSRPLTNAPGGIIPLRP
jgi:hypothetical protein